MNSVKFNIGDKVYCPMWTNKVCVIEDTPIDVVIIEICKNGNKIGDIFDFGLDFDNDGETLIFDGKEDFGYCRVVHATEKNHELLEKLYGIEFEKPKFAKEEIKEGDYVYIPSYSKEPLLVHSVDNHHHKLATCIDNNPYKKIYFNSDGYSAELHIQPIVFLATQYNKERIEQFYQCELENIPPVLESKDGSYCVQESGFSSYNVSEVKYWRVFPQPPKENEK